MRKNLLVLAILICGMALSSCTDKLKKTPNISLNPNIKSETGFQASLNLENSFISTSSNESTPIYPDYYGGYYIGSDRKPVFLVVKGFENIAKLDIKKRVNSDYFSIETCSYSYNQLNAVRKVLREKFGDESQEAMIENLGWVGQYINQQENCIYVMLERCLDSDIAEFKRKVCDSPLIKFKVDSVVVLPH